MTPVPVIAVRFFACPNGCKCRFEVERLIERSGSAGPWYCDECGQAWRVVSDGEQVSVEKAAGGVVMGDGIARKCFVTLEIPPQSESIFFKVRATRYEQTITPKIEEQNRYFYEEHTCPTNWLGDVEEIKIGDDTDPHGLARFVAVYDADAGEAVK